MNLNRVIISALLLSLLAIYSAKAETPSPVADAAEKRDRLAIRNLLHEGVDVNVPQVDGMTALHWAVYNDDEQAARALIDAGADITAKNRYGVNALSLACQNGNDRVVEWLLDGGADPNTTLPGGETALMTASRTGKLGPVKLLIDRGAEVNANELKGQTALMWAAAEGHVDVVNALLDAGADFESPLKSGFTPFFFAVREGQIEVVRRFLDAGIDVNDVMQVERRGGKGPRNRTSPLVLAVENGHFELAVVLLEAGADPNDQRSGFTPLHVVSWVRKPNRGDGEDGDPAPQGSGNLNSLQFVRKLVEHDAKVDARLKRGSSGRGRLNKTAATPFLFAADTADVPLMKLLVELGADPFMPNAVGCTPLMAAAGIGTYAPGEEAGTEEEAIEAVRFLLELGADINTVDDNGETAMHGAAYKNLPKMVEFLADNGADISVWNEKNKYGWTPLTIARGYRPGNFKPSPATVAAIVKVMHSEGVSIPADVARTRTGQAEEYQSKDQPSKSDQSNP